MTFDYGRAEKTAQRLLARFGRGAMLIQLGPNTGTEADPVFDSPVEVPCTVVELQFSLRDREGSLVGAADRRLLVSTEGLDSGLGREGKIELDGHKHTILRIDPLSPGGKILMFEVQIGR